MTSMQLENTLPKLIHNDDDYIEALRYLNEYFPAGQVPLYSYTARVMAYTGLVDKHGKEICIGDIWSE